MYFRSQWWRERQGEKGGRERENNRGRERERTTGPERERTTGAERERTTEAERERERQGQRERERQRQRKNEPRKLNQWREERMRGAIAKYRQIIKDGGVPQPRLLARVWNVPKSTLQRRATGDGHYNHTIGRKQLISVKDEEELAQMISILVKRGFPLRMDDVQGLAYQFAEKKGIKGFRELKKKAGYKWFLGFLRRNPNLSIRKPEGLSSARAAAFNPTHVSAWFDKYYELVETLGLENVPDHIWNCDETGLQDHFLSTAVVAEVRIPCFEVTGGEKGGTTTCLASLNAAGGYGPTMIIFKGKRVRSEWSFGAPQNTFLRVSDNGWINADLFTEWGKCFLQGLPKNDPRPHLLLVDGHSSHVYNLTFLNMMKENNICVFSLPPHTTHYLQPADRALFKSLKHYWWLEGRRITRESGGKRLDKTLFMPLFSKAWLKAATPSNAQAGFRASAIYPFNPAKINENLFMPSQTSERSFQETPVDPEPATQCHASPDAGEDEDFCHLQTWEMEQTSFHPLHEVVQPVITVPQHSLPHPPLSTAAIPPPVAEVAEEVDVVTQPDISFKSLIKIPVRESPSTSHQRAKPPSYNLTSDAHFSFIEEEGGKNKGKKQKPKQKKRRQDDREPCAICRHTYGDMEDPKATEDWLSCAVCAHWFHESCAEDSGVLDDDGSLTCKDCLFPENE